MLADEAAYLVREGLPAPPLDRAHGLHDHCGTAEDLIGAILARVGELQAHQTDRNAVRQAVLEVHGSVTPGF